MSSPFSHHTFAYLLKGMTVASGGVKVVGYSREPSVASVSGGAAQASDERM